MKAELGREASKMKSCRSLQIAKMGEGIAK
jgi:hypothetical protein